MPKWVLEKGPFALTDFTSMQLCSPDQSRTLQAPSDATLSLANSNPRKICKGTVLTLRPKSANPIRKESLQSDHCLTLSSPNPPTLDHVEPSSLPQRSGRASGRQKLAVPSRKATGRTSKFGGVQGCAMVDA